MDFRGAFVADWYSGTRGTAFDAGRRSIQQLFVLDLMNTF